MQLIASIMAAPDYKARFQDAITLLNYGYACCRLYEDKEMLPLPDMSVVNGVEETVPLAYEGTFSYLSMDGEDLGAIEKQLVLEEFLTAPVEQGQPAGFLTYTLNGRTLGQVPIVTAGNVEEAGYLDYLKDTAFRWLMAGTGP